MIKIAIQGHPTKGKEVARILESLGGKDIANHSFKHSDLYYYLDSDNFIICSIIVPSGYSVYTLEEFEKEFPFKIGDKVTIIGLPDFPKVITQMVWDCDEILYSFEGLNNTWFGAKSLKKFEMKKERNITLTLDKAKEWYSKGGELREIALQAYSEEELTKVELSKSWDEFCKRYPIKKDESYINSEGKILSFTTKTAKRGWNHICPSRKSAEAHLAMIQLEQLRNCWWNGWEPIWDASTKYAIKRNHNEIHVIRAYNISAFLVFPTREMAEEFLECFRDLIELCGELL